MEAPYVGEVIESSTVEFTVQCWELHTSPSFGSFVIVDSTPPIIGIVFNVSTRSIEPNRRPMAYGKREEELMMEQPQIFELLKTEFEALVLGYSNGLIPRQMLPPHPPRIHSFVRSCSPSEAREFTNGWDFLRSILYITKVPPDELAIAAIRSAYEAHNQEMGYLVQTGKELSRLVRGDYDRLSSILRRVTQ